MIWSPRSPRAGGLADERCGKALAALCRPLEQLDGAVHRVALLIPGDEEGEPPAEAAAAPRHEAERRGDHGGEPAFHVDRAAAEEHAVDDLRRERRMPPALLRPRRHHVDMAGKRQMPLALPDRGEEILNRIASGRLEARPLDRKASGRKKTLDDVEGGAHRRRDARGANQCGENFARACNRLGHDGGMSGASPYVFGPFDPGSSPTQIANAKFRIGSATAMARKPP